jgi:hypothetical protein
MIGLVCALAWALLAGPARTPPGTTHFVRSLECPDAFEFHHPSDWVAVFAAKMDDYDVDLYTLDVRAETRDFLVAAAENYFDFDRGKWVLLGRQGIQGEVEVVSTARWHRLQGVTSVGCSYERQGGYAGSAITPYSFFETTSTEYGRCGAKFSPRLRLR